MQQSVKLVKNLPLAFGGVHVPSENAFVVREVASGSKFQQLPNPNFLGNFFYAVVSSD